LKGIIGSVILGLLFGVVSSPCATPVLAVILTYVASQGNPVYGASLLFVYALGHCILMLAAGTFAGMARVMIESKGLARFSMIARRTSGVIVILAGLYLLFLPLL
jgi:cytochrome c-type biogenesis protein